MHDTPDREHLDGVEHITKGELMEDKIYQAIREKYGYGDEGDKLVDWLMENLK